MRLAISALLVCVTGCTVTPDPATPSAAAPGQLPSAGTGKPAHVPSVKQRPRSLHAASRSLRRPALGSRLNFAALARCESGGDWHINTGNSYYGGLQMTLAFWRSFGGLRFASRPDLATEAQQLVVAERGLAAQGPGSWPVCGSLLGAS